AATGPGGARFMVNTVGAAQVTSLVLTDAEVATLAASGTISATAAQCYMVANGEGGGVGGPPGGSGDGDGTPTRNTKKNAEILKRNMKAKGVKFNKGDAAHHITPSTHPLAKAARQFLDDVGIDINQAENGVALNFDRHMRTGLHTQKWINTVA